MLVFKCNRAGFFWITELSNDLPLHDVTIFNVCGSLTISYDIYNRHRATAQGSAMSRESSGLAGRHFGVWNPSVLHFVGFIQPLCHH